MAKEICEDCGRVFEAGPYSFFCPECRKRRISKASSERAKRIGLSRMGVEARWGKKRRRRKMAVRPIDGDALRKELTCNFAGEPFHGNRKVTIGEVRRIIESMPTLTPTTIGHCKDCDNWNEQFSAGRKSLNNYVCYCSEWSNPEIGYERYTLPNDYCSHFEPKEGMKDGKNG